MDAAGRPGRPGPTSEPALPRSGEVLHLTRAASVQFCTPIKFRVIRVLDWPTYTGWVWLDGYQLNDAGEATERRSIFVQIAGLERLPGSAAPGKPRGGTGRAGQPPGSRPTPLSK